MAEVKNISIDQAANAQFDISVIYANNAAVDLSTYTAAGLIKKHTDSANSAAFTADAFANGILRLSLTAIETANLEGGKYVYEATINHTASNTTTRVQEGIMYVRPNV
jgi:hypothetical protein